MKGLNVYFLIFYSLVIKKLKTYVFLYKTANFIDQYPFFFNICLFIFNDIFVLYLIVYLNIYL